jgi:hypothetical protein
MDMERRHRRRKEGRPEMVDATGTPKGGASAAEAVLAICVLVGDVVQSWGLTFRLCIVAIATAVALGAGVGVYTAMINLVE